MLDALQRNASLVDQRVVRWGDHHQRVVHERLGHQVHVPRRAAHDDQIGFVRRERRQQSLAVGHVEAEADLGVATTERRQQTGGEVVRRAGDRDRQSSAPDPFELLDDLFGLGQLLGDGAAVVV